jgi:hypothetical protein
LKRADEGTVIVPSFPSLVMETASPPMAFAPEMFAM